MNQEAFYSNAPNPVSLLQIIGYPAGRNELMDAICKNILELYQELDTNAIRTGYNKIMYRRVGFNPFKTDTESFNAKIVAVYPDGKLELETQSGERREYYFKEVQFIP